MISCQYISALFALIYLSGLVNSQGTFYPQKTVNIRLEKQLATGEDIRTVLVTPYIYYQETKTIYPQSSNLTFNDYVLGPFVYNLNVSLVNQWIADTFPTESDSISGDKIPKFFAPLLDSELSLLKIRNSSGSLRFHKRDGEIVQYNIISSANTIAENSHDVHTSSVGAVFSAPAPTSNALITYEEQTGTKFEYIPHHVPHHVVPEHPPHYPYAPYYVPKMVASGDAYYATCPQGYSPSTGFLCASDCPREFYYKRGPVCLGKCESLALRADSLKGEKWHSALLFCLRTWRFRFANTTDCPWYDSCGVGPARGCAKCEIDSKGRQYDHQIGCTCHRSPSLKPRYGSRVRSFKKYGCPNSPKDRLLTWEPLLSPVPLCYRCDKNPNDWRCR